VVNGGDTAHCDNAAEATALAASQFFSLLPPVRLLCVLLCCCDVQRFCRFVVLWRADRGSSCCCRVVNLEEMFTFYKIKTVKFMTRL